MVVLYAISHHAPSIIAASLDLAALAVHKRHHGFNTSMHGAAAVVGRLPNPPPMVRQCTAARKQICAMRRACTPTPQQWAHIVGMLASARAGTPEAQSARTWVKRRRKGTSLRALYTKLRNVKNIRRLESAQQSLHPLALRTVLPRRLGRGAAVFRRRSCATRRATGVRSEDTGPCRRPPAALGSAADICGYLALASL